eukprot:767646-Hanusia_phi.AAC.11
MGDNGVDVERGGEIDCSLKGAMLFQISIHQIEGKITDKHCTCAKDEIKACWEHFGPQCKGAMHQCPAGSLKLGFLLRKQTHISIPDQHKLTGMRRVGENIEAGQIKRQQHRGPEQNKDVNTQSQHCYLGVASKKTGRAA